MRTDSADVRPNARLISIKCRIRAVSARVARGERGRTRRGARNLWKFCKWPLMGQKNFSEKKTPGKKSGREIFPAAGEHHPCRPSDFYALWQSILPQQCLFGTKLPMISTLDDICWKWSKRASSTSIVASLYRLAVVPFHLVQQLDRNVA
jgi:hypothetical protein